MRPLTDSEAAVCGAPRIAPLQDRREWHESNLRRCKGEYHSRCLFGKGQPVENLRFTFTKTGELEGSFICDGRHEGYDGIAHGGILAAIIDASMTQCLMGHGVAAFTAELSVRYRAPVKLFNTVTVFTRIAGAANDRLYSVVSSLMQERRTCVVAKAKFLPFR